MYYLKLGDELVANIVFVNRKIRFNNKKRWKRTGVFVPVGRFKDFLGNKESNN